MSPRKKSKPNPLAEQDRPGAGEVPLDSSVSTQAPTPSTSTPNESTVLQTTSSHSFTEARSESSDASETTTTNEPWLSKKPSKKWLSGGSWRSKASATVKTASQSIGISVSGGAASEIPTDDEKKAKDQSPAKFLTKRKSSKADSIPASMTMFNVSSDGSIDEQNEAKPEEPPKEPARVDEPPLPPDPPKIDATQQAGTWGWRSWWSRPDGYTETSKTSGTEDAQGTPLPGVTPMEDPNAAGKELGKVASPEVSRQVQDVEMKDVPTEVAPESQDAEMKDADAAKTSAPAARTSWFWSWSSKESAPANLPVTAATPTEYVPDAPNEEILDPQIAETTKPQESAQESAVTDAPSDAPAPDATAKERSNSTGWAFWFKSQPKAEVNSDGAVAHKLVGEVAVSDTPSQSHPEPAQFNELEQAKTDAPKAPEEALIDEPAASRRSFLSLRGRTRAKTAPKEIVTDTPSSSKTVTPSKTSPAPSPTRPDTAPSAQPVQKAAPKAKEEPQNILLPEFQNTYQLVQQPSFWQQVRQYFLGNEVPQPHLHINPAPPRIKKAVAIGVHGFFPSPMFRKVIGEPKGTSIRFSTAAATAIETWCEERGYRPEISNIALEGEGFIADRVKTLWTLLLNDVDAIRKADFVLVACHSQGVPVAVMLVAKLIQFGCVSSTRIGICAMAGINMGPFPEYRTKYLGPIASELFNFGDPKSLVSQMYLAALDEVLRFGVRVTYIGSIDDQLVSLESSTFSVISHPYVYRAVFVDGRLHTPSFLTHLVGFALKLRNLGLPDHGLIRELSPHLAGSIYGGEGHSRVYEDPRVYALAIQHTLETTSLPVPAQNAAAKVNSFAGINIPVPGAKFDAKNVYRLHVREYKSASSQPGENPYFLPWAMRGLLEEDVVKRELGREVDGLLAMFEEWKPTDKRLKDVKFRLEGVRSKL
ncbi:hypothetical protein BU23DRAFT_580903 [Bimuria novae-zelandiae CBS 107.79]|uniref:YMC020W-like alpha/beta hydrolase domain-containing protein n=1 Tax=Bimuria novae-zelandiae CBS 107.79 TaxID=1447943 RepID=A0A6A5VGX9_9PLEO|nr:hypothetical protein BU23DRAFT_580903 [Bimuria novae-zelandiae CBS 107.79]